MNQRPKTLEMYLSVALSARILGVPKLTDFAGLVPPPAPQFLALLSAFGLSQDKADVDASVDLEMFEDFCLVLPELPGDLPKFWTELRRHIICFVGSEDDGSEVVSTSPTFMLVCDKEQHGFSGILFELSGQTLHVLASP